MQLNTIIIKGFKSFPEKTILKFNEGITSIVGPNGSGKSNIIGAIRWVMGEQSAKTLRGSRMNDVIFSGTDKRKALNIAEVEIILDNSDNYLDVEYEEVSVLRRISRTGESTYMINQQECRLKDIIDLFMDSGLGKESFSIISQGQVEAIFNSKPEERRGIFEEAAGVFKYKVRKKDAEKKLDETQENLDRVQDIIYELEAQLEPLKQQSDIASSYLNQKEKLVDLDIGVTVWQIQEYLNSIKTDKKQLKKITNEIAIIHNEMNSLAEKASSVQLHLDELEHTRERLNLNIIDVVRNRERTEASLNLFDEKTRHRESFINEKETTIYQINQSIQKLEEELEKISSHYKENTEKLEQKNRAIAKYEQERSYLEGDRELKIEELRNEYIHLLQSQTSSRNNLNHLDQEILRSEKIRVKTEELSSLETEKDNLQIMLDEKNINYNETATNLKELLTDFTNLEELLNNSKGSMRLKNERLAQLKNDLEKAKAKQSSLNEMQENYTGYYAGVRSVMKNKQKLNGIIGTVAELIHVPKYYIQAIDTVLSSSRQFIIVANEKAGRDAINYLKSTQSGRATFLPLTTIKPRYITNDMKNKIGDIEGFLGVASDLVSYDSNIQVIVENLLGQTIVAKTLDAANKIAAAIQFRNRVVSLEGDIINAGGSMTGGGSRTNNTSPLFTQKAELTALENYISETNRVFEKLVLNQDKDNSEILENENKLNRIRESGETTRLAEQQLKNEIEYLQAQLDRLEKELKVTSFEASENNDSLRDLQLQKQKRKEQFVEITEEIDECKLRMKFLTSEKENIELEKMNINDALIKINEDRNIVRETLASTKSQMKSTEDHIKLYENQIKELKEEILLFDQNMEIDSKEGLKELFDKYTKQQITIEKKQLEAKNKIKSERIILKEVENDLDKLAGRNKYLVEEKSKLEVVLSRNDVRLDHNLNYLVEEYKIGFEEARLLKKPDMELEEAQKQVRLLKKGIEELGPVNVNAIKEFKDVNERYQFLSNQQNDLIEAKANLYNTMDEMDAIVETQFKETFDRIQEQFSIVFPKMFGGGYAELLLDEPDNLLETGVEIIAQPPGKRLTRLSLLSGGERALTAISLLFAIIQVNPIPFCILDEAEAALDDANVDRFGRFLQEFEEDTQFIIITHRKGTMEHADQLYGVTMQEKGVSKIVAVSLNEAQVIEGIN